MFLGTGFWRPQDSSSYSRKKQWVGVVPDRMTMKNSFEKSEADS